MSTLSQFAPFAGGGLKSFQTGYVDAQMTVTGAAPGVEDGNYTDVTISTSVVNKTMTSFQGSASLTRGAFFFLNGSTTSSLIPTTRLTSTTNLRIATSRYVDNFAFVAGRWQVAEAN